MRPAFLPGPMMRGTSMTAICQKGGGIKNSGSVRVCVCVCVCVCVWCVCVCVCVSVSVCKLDH